MFLAVLTLAAIGLPTTSGFTGEFLVLLGAFQAAWPLYADGSAYPLVLAGSAVAGVVLGALYMLGFAQKFLFGVAKAPHQPFGDLSFREGAILSAIVVAVFALGLFPDGPMKTTELAALQYRQLVTQRPHRWRGRLAYRGACRSPTLGRGSVRRRRRESRRDPGRHAMNWAAVAVAMLPEHLLLVGIVVLLVLEIARGTPREAYVVSLAAVALATAAAVWLALGGFDVAPFPGQFSVDAAAASGKAIVLALALLVLGIARDDFGRGAFPILLLSSLYGVCLLLSSDSFLTLFLGLELMSLPVYALILIAYRRPESAEAALKYLVLGRRRHRDPADGRLAALRRQRLAGTRGVHGRTAIGRHDGARRRHAGPRRVLPQGRDRAIPRMGAGRLRGGRDPRHGVHGHGRQGRRPARRRSVVRHRAAVAGDGRCRRAAAPAVDRLGQPRGDAAAEPAPHDRLFVHRPRGVPLLRLPG